MNVGESPTPKQVILPQESNLALFETTHGELRYICQLPFSSLDNFTTSTSGWVVGISGTETPSIISWNAQTRTAHAMPLPNNHVPHSIAMVGQILYVGGEAAFEDPSEGFDKVNLPFLGLYDLSQQPQKWKPIQLEFAGDLYHDKAVDGLLIDGTRLIVFDNVVTPCWAFIYDIQFKSRSGQFNLLRLV